MMIELVDFSRTAWSGSPTVTALKEMGKLGVGRYAVNDKSPSGRGITADEYQRLTLNGIDVFLFWEGVESWMLGGFEAGVAAARNADANILAAGMPPKTPVYFAHDIDPQPQHFEAIRLAVEGAASVVGWDRMGVYGGWLLIDHLAPIYDLMHYYCQTLAWMYGRGWHPKATLQQYAFNVWIDGTNCDLVRATREDYGQARFTVSPPPPTPTYPAPWLPEGWKDWANDPNATVKRVGGRRFRPVRLKFVVKQATIPRVLPSFASFYAGPKIDARTKIHSVFIVDSQSRPGQYWIQRDDGAYVAGSKCSPKVTIEPW